MSLHLVDACRQSYDTSPTLSGESLEPMVAGYDVRAGMFGNPRRRLARLPCGLHAISRVLG